MQQNVDLFGLGYTGAVEADEDEDEDEESFAEEFRRIWKKEIGYEPKPRVTLNKEENRKDLQNYPQNIRKGS